MSEIIKETENTVVEEVPSVATSADSENFVELLNDTLVDDSVIKCTVYGITPTEVQVDIPKNHILGGLTGIVPNEEFSSDPNVDPSKEVKIGDEINLVIMKKNDAEGTVLLSKKRADALKSWVDIIDGKEDGRIFEGTVIEAIKGGVIVSSNGSNVFVPASLATERRGDSLDGLLKKNVEFRIIDVDPRRKRAVGSIRSVLAEKKQQIADAFWAQVEEGKSYTGTVKSLTNYGAFVDIGGVDGMVHISEMSWRRIKNPSEIFEVGQEVEVYVKSLDRENKKISLGYRKDEDNPWVILQKNYPEGSVIEAEIVGLTTFGAFARVIPGIDGLIHISQIANHRVEKPENELSIGEKVTCKITGIDYDKKRVSLSIRALLPAEPEVEEAAEEAAAPAEEAAEEAAEAVEEAAAPAEEAAEEAAEAVEEAAAPVEEAVEEAAEAVEEAAAPVEEAVEEAAEAVEEAAAPVEEAVEEAAEAAEEAAAPVEEAVEEAAEAAAPVEEAVEEAAEAAEEAAAPAEETPAE
jgi:4-hydroxy-3-methylbut-2-enyl diphosphate reductase